MPPRDSKADHLRKNRVSVRDVLDHPIERVPSAIHALLSRPHPLNEDESRDVFAEASFVFIKAQEALQCCDRDAFVACMKLLSTGFEHSAEIRAQGAECFANSLVLQTLESIFLHVVDGAELRGDDQNDFSALEALLDVLDCACEGSVATKEAVGAIAMVTFSKMMVQVHLPFKVLRSIARCMIKLIVSSKANKNRLDPWDFLGKAFCASTDVYFQLQIAELIYRIGREKKSLVGTLGLPEQTAAAFRALPSSAKLMELLVKLVEEYNDIREPRLVIYFSLSRFSTGASTPIFDACRVYFDPEHFTILQDALSQPVTIPYTAVRSLRTGKDRVSLRLGSACPSIAHLMSFDASGTPSAAGDDVVHLHMSAGDIVAFKDSSVHKWIGEVLRKHKTKSAQAAAAAAGAKAKDAKRERDAEAAVAVAAGADAASDSSPAHLFGASSADAANRLSEKRKRREETASVASHAASAATPGAGRSPQARQAQQSQQQSPKLVTQQLRLSIDAPLPSSSKQRPRLEEEDAALTAADATTPARHQQPRKSIAPVQQPQPQQPQQPLGQKQAAAIAGDVVLIDTLMARLRQVIEDKIAKKRDEAHEILSNQMQAIQRQVNDARAEVDEGLAMYDQGVRTEIANLRHHEEQASESMLLGIDELNRRMQDFKAGSHGFSDQLRRIDEEGSRVIDGAKRAEEQKLLALKAAVESKMRSLEVRVNAIAASSKSDDAVGSSITGYLRGHTSDGHAAMASSSGLGGTSQRATGLLAGSLFGQPSSSAVTGLGLPRKSEVGGSTNSRATSRSIPSLQIPF